MRLTEGELKLITQLRQDGVLENVNNHRLDPKGVILVACGDCDRFPDIYRHKRRSYRQAGKRHARLHLHCWNGGALRLVPGSPANKPGRSTAVDFQEDVLESERIKRLHTVALYVHRPCAKAANSKMGLLQQMLMLYGAKRELKKKNNKLHVACFVHIDYGTRRNKRQKSYFMSCTKFISWYALRADR